MNCNKATIIEKIAAKNNRLPSEGKDTIEELIEIIIIITREFGPKMHLIQGCTLKVNLD